MMVAVRRRVMMVVGDKPHVLLRFMWCSGMGKVGIGNVCGRWDGVVEFWIGREGVGRDGGGEKDGRGIRGEST